MSEPVPSLKPHERIIVAVDVPTISQAIELVDELHPHVGLFKFGMEFWKNMKANLLREEDEAVAIQQLREYRALFARLGTHYMHDEKDFDIPNTHAGSARGIARMAPEIFTIHAPAGVRAMQESVKNSGLSKPIAITVPTTMTEDECIESFGLGTLEAVRKFTGMARRAGAGGIVCSPGDAKFYLCPDQDTMFLNVGEIICPNTQPLWAAGTDQNVDRALTPGEAAKVGITRLVIGRAITKPPIDKFATRRAAAIAIAEEIAAALASSR